MTRTIDELTTEARKRGAEAGKLTRTMALSCSDIDAPFLPEWSPLSGEWAGESTHKLLGDLLDAASKASDDDYGWEAITDAYETAALDAYYGEGSEQ